MLVLARKPSEQIQIGDDIVITIVRGGMCSVKVGIDAPRGVRIVRKELDDLVERPVVVDSPVHS